MINCDPAFWRLSLPLSLGIMWGVPTNQSNQKDNKGWSFVHVQDIIPCYGRPFLYMKCSSGNGKQCLVNYNMLCAYVDRIVVMVEFLDMFKLGTIAIGGRLSYQATCPLQKEFRLNFHLYLSTLSWKWIWGQKGNITCYTLQ